MTRRQLGAAAAAALLLLGLAAGVQGTESSQAGGAVTVDPWKIPDHGSPYADRQAKVGDSVTFKWSGTHGVYSIPSGDCPEKFEDKAPLKEIAAPKDDGEGTVKFDQKGTRWYACPVDGHCDAGMKIKFTIS
ncbi:mavicyanin-like [Micractinium conductrix]|uniref:Mavicyanin-like n=1 Tax=Micractinium conductrix TaxID=554055 RepID=A0A2P6V1D8_9CHLO|nr:mavicyanin-like [Micractinium conductrix]|eukprot:PSC67893.1 mavicyanin-like [Micractinium conductrix]